ncbi:hypothetical protein [Pseudoalteromonas sp. B160]|uniref:hypothetical protein n=1 Tax=Pseudoalteromonas sp. B160 TaxID=630414 RepID=UPI00301CD96D
MTYLRRLRSHQLCFEGLSVMLGWKTFAAKASSYTESREGSAAAPLWLTKPARQNLE